MTRHSSMTSAGHMHAHVALVALTAVSCALTVGAQDGLTLWPVCGRFYGPVGNTPEPYVRIPLWPFACTAVQRVAVLV